MFYQTTVGQPFQIDEQDLPLVQEYSCIRLNHDGYVLVKRPGETKYHRLHRLIMRPQPGELVDHRFGDRLDNRRENLRVCTLTQNNRNFPKARRPSTSEFKGVSLHRDRWRARIYLNNRCICLGLFGCPVEAAEAYDQAAMQHHGPLARLNFNYSEEIRRGWEGP